MNDIQERGQQGRAAVYVDGYNLYHPIHELGEPFLKWFNLWRLSEFLCAPAKLSLRKVVYCTALPEHNSAEHDLQISFNSAQLASGVTVLKGHFVYDPELRKYSEKQSDINVALSLILDAIDDVYDWAFLVSADSDQAATARVFADRFPNKNLVSVAPPNRIPPKKSRPYVRAAFSVKVDQIEAAVMPAFVSTPSGALIRRPEAYDPPDWWVHPDDRPNKKGKA